MKPGSFPFMWQGTVISMISLLLASTVGWGALLEAQTQATPLVDPRGATNKVDQPAQIISEPKPRYPKTLLDSLVSGRVELQYVIDTAGHAEPNSIRVISKTHEEFVEPAKEAILASVFRPAQFRGQLVRQLMQQNVIFYARPNSHSSYSSGLPLLATLLTIPLLYGLIALMLNRFTALSRRPAPSTPESRVLAYGMAARVFVSFGSIIMIVLGSYVFRESSVLNQKYVDRTV